MTRLRLLAAALAVLTTLAACSEKPQPPPEARTPVRDEMAELQETVRANPRDTDSWMHIADLYERGQAFEKEADALLKVLAIEPGRSFAHLKLGNTYNRLGRYEDAVASYLEAKKARPNDPVLYNNLAFSYGKLGRTKEQIAALRQAVALRPRYATARVNLGRALLHAGDRAGAQEQYEALRVFDETAADSLKGDLDGGRKP
ncbi:MAG TPA: tetratricopeptide repeat protein [bacterium]